METKIKLLKPLRQFYCDHCGEVINSPEEGWVEFLSEPNGIGCKYFGFQIVHIVAGCDGKNCLMNFHKPNGNSIELDKFIGKSGIMELLDFLDEGDIFDTTYLGCSIKDMREFVELSRRLTVPYYEQARQYWQQAREDGWLESNNTDGLYGVRTFKALIAEYSMKGDCVLKF